MNKRPTSSAEANTQRIRITIEGVVQGVGFRPFIYRQAVASGVTGWVLNNSQGVLIEGQGSAQQVSYFLYQIQQNLPPLAEITALHHHPIALQRENGFTIRHSEQLSDNNAQVAADSDVCSQCLAELFDSADRRYRYPFINCTNCGPRYSIITKIPYDRPNTTMASFPMCPRCQGEYDDPTSRRFHAQPNACSDCGPRLRLCKNDGTAIQGDPLAETVALLTQGKIVAIKGLGGYHLAVDASNNDAVAELRRRKLRDEKPFALMSFDLDRVKEYACVDDREAKLLESPRRPIVLLEKKDDSRLAESIAPGNRYLGVMLPATPLHYLLLHQNFSALIMTSGNQSDEPIAFEERDALKRLAPIADYLLSHDRDIHVRVDDSIVRVMAERPMLLRRSRGYAPGSLQLPMTQQNVLALGAELKNTFCLTRHNRAYLSQHIGDLKNIETYRSFEQGITQLQSILEWQPQVIAHDLHPDYLSTRYAHDQTAVPTIAVQHHHAHMASCMAENNISEPCIGMIFDGIGYGEDGNIWGGEFLIGDYASYRRIGHFAYLPMPGGDAATKEPYRMAVSALYHAYGQKLPELPLLDEIPAAELKLLLQMMAKGINSPLTSSCGRLFDGVAALLGLRTKNNYEGQAPLELEMSITGTDFTPYPYDLSFKNHLLIFDPTPCLRAIVEQAQKGVPNGQISGRFHMTLVYMLVDACRMIREKFNLNRVVLSGGVFQNRFLTEHALKCLRVAGFETFSHSQVPPNDGGLSLGQAVVAGAQVAQRP